MTLNEDEFDDFLQKSVSDYDSGELDDVDTPKQTNEPNRDWKGELESGGYPEPKYELYIASKSFPTLEKLFEYVEALGVDIDALKSGRQSSFKVEKGNAKFTFLVDVKEM